MQAIVARGVRKRCGSIEALAGVNLDIDAGEVFALLGPNGAGKTTLVEFLEGYREPTAGKVSVLGVDPRRGAALWKSRIGIVFQRTAIFEGMGDRGAS